MPELGLEYFPSPSEDSDWDSRLASLDAYFSGSIRKWTRHRRELEKEGAPREQCDGLERNVIAPYREMVNAIRLAIDTGNLVPMSEPRLHDLVEHSHAYLALYTSPADRAEYRSLICGPIGRLPRAPRDSEGRIRDLQAGFEVAIFEEKWNKPGVQQPAEVTRREAFRNYRAHQNDGRYNTIEANSRPDAVARAREQIDVLEQICPLFRAGEPHYKPPDFLTPMESAFSREAVRQVFLSAGLKPKHARFGVATVFDGARQKDNPTAWKAIYRKRGKLSATLQKLLGSR